MGAANLGKSLFNVVRQGIDEFDPRFDKRKNEQQRLEDLIVEKIYNQSPDAPQMKLSDLEGRDFITTYSDRTDAGGYVLWAEKVIELDAFNPQVAARLARALDRWEILAEPYKAAARIAIERVAAKPDLSADVREVISRALA